MKIQTYGQAMEYLESHIRMDVFTRYDADKHLKTPLERIEYLLSLLGNPQTKYPSIQVTGTSGKGSTAYLISHILTTAGYKTGFTLSPHLQKANERMQINDNQISDTDFIAVLNEVIPAIEKMTNEPIGKPSYFEILLTMALFYFAKQKVDIVIAEVGLEGKYDGTNVLSPLAVVLTNISLDHTAILGNSIEEITQEAVSAIKKQKPKPFVISGVEQDAVKKIVKDKCNEVDAKLFLLGEDFRYVIRKESLEKEVFDFIDEETLSNLELSLHGEYQIANASLAIKTVRNLQEKGFSVSEDMVRQALKTAFFPGRFEIFQFQGRDIILDGAHNEAKMEAFLSALAMYFPKKGKHFIIGFKRDKNVAEMLKQLLPQAEILYVTQFQKTTDQDKNYAMTTDQIASFLSQEALESDKIRSISDSKEALETAIQNTDETKVIIVTGSLYLVGEIRDYLTGEH